MLLVKKKINNNVVVCTDDDGRHLIAFGKGLGFRDIPYEIRDLNQIQRTFYSVKKEYISLLNEIQEDIVDIAMKVVDYARERIPNVINETLYFVLADHLNFAIDRARKGMYIITSMSYDIKHYYPLEMEVGRKTVSLINKKFDVDLPAEEASNIAFHIVEAEETVSENKVNVEKTIIDEITEIVEEQFKIHIDPDSFNYSRFATHIQYLLMRKELNSPVISDNRNMYEEIKDSYPETFECASKIGIYLKKKTGEKLSNEEILYLMLHINRLRSHN